jgi:hypothetical protein
MVEERKVEKNEMQYSTMFRNCCLSPASYESNSIPGLNSIANKTPAAWVMQFHFSVSDIICALIVFMEIFKAAY